MTSPFVLGSLPFQSVLLELGGWPSWLCVSDQSFSIGKSRAHCWAWWGTFTCEPYHPCVNNLLESWSVNWASIFEGVITVPTLRGTRLEVGNSEWSFSHISEVLEKWGSSKRNGSVGRDVNWIFREISQTFIIPFYWLKIFKQCLYILWHQYFVSHFYQPIFMKSSKKKKTFYSYFVDRLTIV